MRPVAFVVAALAATISTAAAGNLARPKPAIISSAPMVVARAVHTATLLGDGRVLVVGGCSTDGCELEPGAAARAEIYDPKRGAFTLGGRLGTWRDDHTATRLRDGRVLVAGGWGEGGVLSTTETFDPRTGEFSSGPQMASPRAGATATLLRDGRVLVAGGFTDNRPTTSSAELFTKSGFTAVGPLRAPRGAHVAARLPDGRVLVAGGFSRGRVVASTEIFDPRTGRFAPGPAMRVPRYKAAAVELADGRVLVIGGAADVEGQRTYSTTEIYDPRRNRFLPGPRMRSPRYKITGSVARLPGGDVLVAGAAARAERLSLKTMRFRLVPGSLGQAWLFLTATRIGNRVLLVGGYNRSITPTAKTWVYR
jgi:Kelch motif/Galactose oxidase, central domain